MLVNGYHHYLQRQKRSDHNQDVIIVCPYKANDELISRCTWACNFHNCQNENDHNKSKATLVLIMFFP